MSTASLCSVCRVAIGTDERAIQQRGSAAQGFGVWVSFLSFSGADLVESQVDKLVLLLGSRLMVQKIIAGSSRASHMRSSYRYSDDSV